MVVSKEAAESLATLSSEIKRSFDEDRTLLSYAEWFQLLLDEPGRNLRSAAQYARDTFEHFGTEERALPQGKILRYRLFDAPWANGDGRVAGQEPVQNEIYRLISNFVRDGRISKLIILHGPNGSAKSSMVRCIQRAMEQYSRTPSGALYSYAWIFPSEKIVKSRLGFDSAQGDKRHAGSYAQLPAEQIDARLPCELRDHPIFFVPRAERLELIARLLREGRLPSDFTVSRYILDGDLSPRDRAIYDALLMAHDGDHAEVLRHVQVERFFISTMYSRGIASIEPQMHVDAEARQLTADRSIANLPRSLQTVPLYELQGPLIAANRGLLEYSDLLKRPVEAFKYLLTTSEEASASLPQFKIHLDELLIASSNELQLEAFKEYPDWHSFKGRIELVRVPYLRRFSDEIEVYQRQITQATIDKPLAPHVVEVAALWAVLTRLKWPDPDSHPKELRDVIKKLRPLDKLALYDTGKVPGWCTASQARLLSTHIEAIYDEYRTVLYYEGQLGASAREIRTLILNAAHRPQYRCLTPLPIFDELDELVQNTSLYAFLKQEPRDGYHEHTKFIETVRDWWLDILEDELRTSMGLVEETRVDELFSRYVLNVSHSVKKEKLLDKVMSKYVDPDEDLMREVEAIIAAKNEDRAELRRALIGRIGAWGLENAGRTPDYRELFPNYMERLEADYFAKQRKLIARNLEYLLVYLGEEVPKLPEEQLEMAKRTTQTMEQRYGYARVCTAECAAYAFKVRYADQKD